MGAPVFNLRSNPNLSVWKRFIISAPDGVCWISYRYACTIVSDGRSSIPAATQNLFPLSSPFSRTNSYCGARRRPHGFAASPQRKPFRHVNLMTLLKVYTFETSSAQTSTSASRSFGPALLTYALYWPIKPHTTV